MLEVVWTKNPYSLILDSLPDQKMQSWLPLRWRNQNIIDKGPDEKDVAKFKEGELADFRKTVKKIDTGYQTRSYING
jgi:hypothetical protein